MPTVITMPRPKRTATSKANQSKSPSNRQEWRSTSNTNYIEKVRTSTSADEGRPSTSSFVGKKRGLSVRNGERMDNRKQDKGKEKLPQHHSRKKKAETPTTRTTKSQSKRKERDDDDQYTERTVSAQSSSRWKPITMSTRQFVLETLDSAIVNVLNETNSSSYDGVQDRLNILHQRIVGALTAITVPSTRKPNYRHLDEQCHLVEVSVAEASNQVELLETEIEKQLRLIEEKERILENLKSTSQDQANRRKIHPILQDTEDTLALPALKASKAKVNKTSTLPSSSSHTHHKRLAEALKKWQSQDTLKDIGIFMDTLSTVTSSL